MDKAADNANSYTWMANTFKKVDGSVVKLKDFSVKEAQAPVAVKLYFLNNNGATKPDAEGRDGFVFVHPGMCTEVNGWKTGWYAFRLNGAQVNAAEWKKGSESAFWANEVEVPYGQGFGINRMAAATSIVFSGQVSMEDAKIDIPNANSYTWTGNVMPVDLKLKDLSIKEAQAPVAVKLYFLNNNGATKPDAEGRDGFVFVHPGMCTEVNGWKTGWYAFRMNGVQVNAAEWKKGSESAFWANEVDIPAGQGFGINRMAATTTLIVPSPLAD